MWLGIGSLLICFQISGQAPSPTAVGAHQAPSAGMTATPRGVDGFAAGRGAVSPMAKRPGESRSGGLRGDPCEGATWNNGYLDGMNGYTSENAESAGWIVSWTVDDVDLPDGQIELACWYSMDSSNDSRTEGEMVIVASDGSAPIDGTEVVERGSLGREQTDDVLFGYSVYLNSLALNTTVAADVYYVGFRPIFDDLGRSFIATAPLTGTDSFLKSDFFGYPEWTAWEELVGVESNVSFCLFITEGGEPTGACCKNGDCTRVTRAECDAAGGDYRGDGTNCRPNKCPGAPAACCFEDASCVLLKEQECAAAGGKFQGEGLECTAGLCPLPDVCAGALYNNLAYDGVNGFSSEDGGDIGWIVSWMADDAPFEQRVDLLGLHWYTLDSKNLEPTGADYAIWYARPDCGGPARKDAPLFAADNVPLTLRATDGTKLFGYPVWLNSIETTAPHALVPGSYYFGLRLQMESFDRSFRASAPLTNCEAYFQSDYFGIPDFTGGERTDVSFCLTGRTGGDPIGACCLGSNCEEMSAQQCRMSGGAYQGDDASCYPNPCPGAPGACCLTNGVCEFVSPEDCAGLSGDFQGGDVECRLGVCPIPEYCSGDFGDVLYNNSTYNGYNAIWNVWTEDRSGFIDLESVADVFNPYTDFEIRSIHYYQATTRGFNYTERGSYALYVADGPKGTPGTNLIDVHNAPEFRLDTGQLLFGFYPIYLHNLINLSASIGPGVVWIGARPQTDKYRGEATYIMTADAIDRSAYARGPGEEWDEYAEVDGRKQDIAMCIVGRITGELTGQCCLNGDCFQETRSACEARGGEYTGDGTRCVPNTCPGAPGACCLKTAECRELTRKECDAEDGTFYGEGTSCQSEKCDPVDFCSGAFGDVLYTNSTNEVSGLWNVFTEDRSGFIDGECADDVLNIYESFNVTSLHSYQVERAGFEFTERGSIAVYAADGPGGIPGTPILELHDTSAYRVGHNFGWFPVFSYHFDDLSITLPAGRYWFSMRPQTPVYDGEPSYHMTADVIDTQGYFRSPYFTGDVWVTSESQMGSPQDFAFCIVGKITGEPTGQCCLDGDCFQETRGACEARGGEYTGDGTRCTPNTCPGAPGGCCVDRRECRVLKRDECAAQGGEFLGEASECRRISCIDSACNAPGNFYSNGEWDGQNGFFAMRWDDGGYDSVTATDISLSLDTTITRISFLTLEFQASAVGTDIIYLPNSGCTPGEDSEVWALDQDYERIDIGGFGFYSLYLYNVTTEINLTAGDWYVGARPVISNYTGPTYNATATIVDCLDVWRGVEFGQPTFTTVGYDFAFCFAAEVQNPCEGIVCGDSNGSGAVDFDDIDCFVAALIGADNWVACGTQQPGSAYVCANDTNGDQTVDFDDIDGFVFAVINGECP